MIAPTRWPEAHSRTGLVASPHAIAIDADGLHGGSDPRADGAAVGR